MCLGRTWMCLPEGRAGQDHPANLMEQSIFSPSMRWVFAAQGSLLLNPEPFEEAGWIVNETGHGMNCTEDSGGLLMDLTNRNCLSFFYGFLSLNGGAGCLVQSQTFHPAIVSLYIAPEVELNPVKPWLDVNGDDAEYTHMLIRFGMTSPEDFPGMAGGMEEYLAGPVFVHQSINGPIG